MRVISGTFKGRRLDPKKIKSARPTTDFAREGLFNVLRHQIDFEGLKVLDLFSGTGAIALEFVSRGAASVTCIERSVDGVKFIASIAESWNIQNLQVLKADVLRFLESTTATYDVVFADPPYDLDVFDKIHSRVIEGKMLSKNGLFIFEHDKQKNFEMKPGFVQKRTFGHVNFSIFSAPKIDV